MRGLVIILLGFVILTLGCTKQEDLTANIIKEVPSSVHQEPSLQEFLGKPTVIVFASTTCPHCVASMPELEEKIFSPYGLRINLWVNVIDNRRFETTLPQGYNKNLQFSSITGEKCTYVPSWIILDSAGSVVLSSCGNTRSIDDMSTIIEGLLDQK